MDYWKNLIFVKKCCKYRSRKRFNEQSPIIRKMYRSLRVLIAKKNKIEGKNTEMYWWHTPRKKKEIRSWFFFHSLKKQAKASYNRLVEINYMQIWVQFVSIFSYLLKLNCCTTLYLKSERFSDDLINFFPFIFQSKQCIIIKKISKKTWWLWWNHFNIILFFNIVASQMICLITFTCPFEKLY